MNVGSSEPSAIFLGGDRDIRAAEPFGNVRCRFVRRSLDEALQQSRVFRVPLSGKILSPCVMDLTNVIARKDALRSCFSMLVDEPLQLTEGVITPSPPCGCATL